MLSAEQQTAQAGFRRFADEYIAPVADEHDKNQATPPELIARFAAMGYLGGIVPKRYGGGEMDALTWGMLCEEVGRGSASLMSLLTVHGMVITALLKWGSEAQRERWLPRLATGELIGAFGLSEPNVGSDATKLETTAAEDGAGWRLNGQKRWISFGHAASLMLVIARVNGQAAAFLVERGTPGFSTEPITGMMGFRSAMLADVYLKDCVVPGENLVGKVGFGFSHVAGAALDHGRFCIAWGCLGLAQGALNASLSYSSQRMQFGTQLKNHQLIQELVADMITQITATRALCQRAAQLKQDRDPSLIMEISIAKYFASRVANKVASDAVQIHGANGCSDRYPVQRYLRDAKIMEIIEGSNQMQQLMISKYGYQAYQVKNAGAGAA